MKDGKRTTEFWLTVAFVILNQVVFFLTSFEVISKDLEVQILTQAASLLSLVSYGFGRTKLKFADDGGLTFLRSMFDRANARAESIVQSQKEEEGKDGGE